MVLRRGRRASRSGGLVPRPTALNPSQSTPSSSAYPSTSASEVEGSNDPNKLAIGALSLNGKPVQPTFRFLDLPSELRLKVYAYHFADTGNPVDLDPENHKRLYRKLAIFKTCRLVYSESAHYYYSSRSFRIFPTHPGRFFKTKKPLLARLTPAKRACITSLELRLGPGWSKPPRGWVVNPALGLQDCVNVRRLTVFVECDPSDGIFKGFRRANGFYESFSQDLLTEILKILPQLHTVHFDAWSSVKKTGDMMRALMDVTTEHGRMIRWGPERGWTDEPEEEEVMAPLANFVMVSKALDSEPFNPSQQGVLVTA